MVSVVKFLSKIFCDSQDLSKSGQSLSRALSLMGAKPPPFS
nr:MAG TPA: hypothetical protein [Caudoviricetes sp.]